MNKKNLKLIMELIFIFILPLVFICFTSEIQVEREFTYDNNGNYETSQDTKQLSFDNSIIKYTKTETYYYNLNDLIIIENNKLKFNETLYNSIDKFYLPDSTFDELAFNKELNYYDSLGEVISYQLGFQYIMNEDTELNFMYYQIINDNYSESSLHQFANVISIDNGKYLLQKNDNIKSYFINYVNIFNNNVELENEYYISLADYTKTINTIWGNIKELLIDNLDLNDNVLLDIVLCYTILWFIMWIIWHLFYSLFELLWHVIPSPIERRL